MNLAISFFRYESVLCVTLCSQVEALYNIVKYGRVKDKAAAYTEARTKLLKKTREKQCASFRAKTIIHFILNPELTHFTHLRSVVVDLECVEDQAQAKAPDAK